MKVIISFAEAQKILSSQIAIALGTRALDIEEIELEIKPPALTGKPEVNLEAIIKAGRTAYNTAGVNVSAKVEAIRAIRNEAYRQGIWLGLGDAKRFVENVIMT